MPHFLTLCRNSISNLLKVLCIVLCFAMVVLVTCQVVARFVLNDPSAITEELTNICFVWMSLLASALLYGERGHMCIAFIPEKASLKKRHILFIISEIATLLMAIFVLTYGGYLIAKAGMFQTNAAMTWLKVGQIYSVVPLSGICVIFYSLYNIIESVLIASGKINEKGEPVNAH